MNAKEWLRREDEMARQGRIERLQWLLEHTPENKTWLFHDGIISQRLFEQTRYCFVYGLYLATIILGMSFIEHTLAALLFASGRDDLERANLTVLIDNAYEKRWINQEEKDALHTARIIRNDVTHFRKPGSKNLFQRETFGVPQEIENFLEIKAQQVLLVVFNLLNFTSVR